MRYQLSIFMENRPGKLEAITKILAQNNINIRGISLASAGEFGVVKIIANESDRAYEVLKKAHFAVSKREIVIALINDTPGSLHDLLKNLSSNNINVEDCYGIVLEEGEKAAIVLEVEKFPEAERVLKANNITVMSDTEI